MGRLYFGHGDSSGFNNGGYSFIFGLEECFDGDLHEISKALGNELTVINDLEQVMTKDFLSFDELVRARARQTGIVLVTSRE